MQNTTRVFCQAYSVLIWIEKQKRLSAIHCASCNFWKLYPLLLDKKTQQLNASDDRQSHSVFKFSLHFREDRDSEIAPTEERLEHQMRTTGQLNASDDRPKLIYPQFFLR